MKGIRAGSLRFYFGMATIFGVVWLLAYILTINPSSFRPEVFTAIGTLLAAVSLAYAGFQLRVSRIIASTEFVLRIYEMLQDYNSIHARLISGGDWSQSDGPETAEEWMDVDRYMGLFEPIQLLLAKNFISIDMIDVSYSHRVIAIARNPIIVRRNLIDKWYRWESFTDLWMSLRSEDIFLAICKREGYHLDERERAAEVSKFRRELKKAEPRTPADAQGRR